MKALQAENELLEHFKKELARASEFYLGMALVTKGGLKLVLASIERCLERRGRGYVLFGVDLPTDPDAIQSLKALQSRHKENFEVRRFQPGTRFFHPKVSVFVKRNGTKTAIIGSSNLTGGGLSKNYEANVLLGSSERRPNNANGGCVRKLAALSYRRRKSPIESRVMCLRLQAKSPDGLAYNPSQTTCEGRFSTADHLNHYPQTKMGQVNHATRTLCLRAKTFKVRLTSCNSSPLQLNSLKL
jgi:HKD family nuclease